MSFNFYSPALHIINAPKTGNPTYIKYDDICYSQSGPRKSQSFLMHLPTWNILLVASANSLEVGVLGTTETGDTPLWKQWTMTDEGRAELPLSADKQETFPIGFALETGSQHRVTENEVEFPVMPMIHLLSTHGYLLSFDFINKSSSYSDICSPPRIPQDTTGISFFKEQVFTVPEVKKIELPKPVQAGSFSSFNTGVTSTPISLPKPKAFNQTELQKGPSDLFQSSGDVQSKPLFGATIPPPVSFGQASQPNTAPVSLPFGAQKPASPAFNKQQFGQSDLPVNKTSFVTPTPAVGKSALIQKADPNQTKPLVTVPQTFTKDVQNSSVKSSSQANTATNDAEQTAAIRSMIQEEIQCFEKELKELMHRSRNINIKIGTKEELGVIVKNLSDVQDFSNQATESTDALCLEIQSLRLGLNECFAMADEAKKKYTIYSNPEFINIEDSTVMSQTSKRQLTRLQNLLSVNEVQANEVNKQICNQWSDQQEMKKMNAK